jgi:transcriptional antiterminator RfaH
MHVAAEGATGRRWYVVYSKPRKEEFAEINLKSKGLRTFFPRLLLPGLARGQRRIVPLFPNYLFVYIDCLSDEYAYVRWSPGVKRLVGFNGSPTPLDESIVGFLIGQADEAGVIRARSSLKVGQSVHISGGPFDGLVGIIQEPPDARGRVKVLMSLLNRQVRVEVPLRFVKNGWVSAATLECSGWPLGH